jgi:hypothetical protein
VTERLGDSRGGIYSSENISADPGGFLPGCRGGIATSVKKKRLTFLFLSTGKAFLKKSRPGNDPFSQRRREAAEDPEVAPSCNFSGRTHGGSVLLLI